MLVQDLRGGKVEILLCDVHAAFTQCVHACFGAHSFELRARTAVHLLGDFGQVDPPGQIHAAAVDAKNICARFDSAPAGVSFLERWNVELNLRRRREFDLAIYPARPKESGIKNVQPISSHNDFDILGRLKAVQLV